ncbi:MAG TPA: HAMP domain-containing sensor histidine kinase [Stenomitos sp.]
MLFQLALTNRMQAEQLVLLQTQVESVDDDVLANIGHELRTPLTIIQGLSEILLDELGNGNLDADQHQDFLRQIHRASVALGKLIETSIMLTKINSGHLTLHMQPLNVAEAIERVISQYGEELSAKELRVEILTPSDLPLVWADGFCLELALQALYDNAIKFNRPQGAITWRLWHEGDAVHVSVTDAGVGIPPEKLPSLFTVFGQLESGPTRRFGGLGLGLPLVHKLLENLGGDITAESQGVNAGATFTFTLKQAAVVS